ncbi:MAG TPA: recombinase RecT [Nitrospiraceae bacterium]|nr:recombinase RecT [Nitrospiraceae bacterium]
MAKAQQTAAARPSLLSEEQVMHQLVQAQTVFKTVATQEQSPLQWDSELDFARAIVMNDPTDRLRQVVPETLANAMRDLAHVGLTLNPVKHFCTLIARWNDRAKVLEAHVMFMYRGLVYLATQAGVHDIQCDVIYKADAFKIARRSDGDYFEHEINITVPRDKDNFFLGAYVAARMPKTGERKVEWVPAEDIFKMREESDSYLDREGKVRPNSPWVKWFDEQAKKSALKRATKRWEESIDEGSRWQRLHHAVDLDHRSEGGTTIEGVATEVEVQKLSVDQITEIETKAQELGHIDVNKYLRKVCAAYGTEVLADIPAKCYPEILERIAASKAEVEKRKNKK